MMIVNLIFNILEAIAAIIVPVGGNIPYQK